MAPIGTAAKVDGGSSPPRFEPDLATLLTLVAPTDHVPVIALLRDQVDPTKVKPKTGDPAGRAVVKALRDLSTATQGGLRQALRQAQRDGLAGAVRPLWIRNAVSFSGQSALIREIASRPEVASVIVDDTIAAPGPVAASADPTPVEPNISLIGAPDLWSLGLRGEGVTLAILDTGVDGSHPDLAARWRGGTNSWFDPYGQHATPTDLSGHGTETAGVILGGTAGGTAIGVAPGARWIAAKIFNDSGTATATAIHLAFQWVLDPDGDPATSDTPSIVNNSWTLGAPGCTLDFEPDLSALVASGITPVFAAGNYGPSAGTSPSPANNPSAVAVGATNLSDGLVSSSSRGPTSCGRPSPTTYPSVTAPGASIRSSDLYATYATATGTSLAAPHVSGALALLHQAAPSASRDQLVAALRAAARDLGVTGPDDTFGAGRIDVFAAYQSLMGPGPTPTPTSSATPTAAPTATPQASATPTSTLTPTPTSSPTPGDASGPLTSVPAVAPNPANGTGPVAIAATISDSTTGASTVVAAEWFRGTVGAPGTGRSMTGSYGSPTVTVSGSIPAAEVAALPEGSQVISVRGRDAAGNWGPLSTASLIVDRTAPNASATSVSPLQSQGAATVQVAATLSDASSTVTAGEWFIGSDPGIGLGTPLVPSDGSFDSAREAVTGWIELAGRQFGELLVSVRGRDAAGSWGQPTIAAALVTPADGVFADGFETGTTTRWSGVSGSSKITVGASGAMAGRFGITITASAGSSGYLTDTSPTAAKGYHARFGFDGRSFTTAGKAIDVFTALTSKNANVIEFQYRKDAAGLPQVRLGVARAGSPAWTGWRALSTGRHSVEIGWGSASSSTATLSIDGVIMDQLTGLDTRSFAIETVRLGPSAGLAKTVSGELQFDRFVSTGGSTVGP